MEVATRFCKVNSSIAVKTQVSGGPPLYPLQHLPPCTLKLTRIWTCRNLYTAYRRKYWRGDNWDWPTADEAPPTSVGSHLWLLTRMSGRTCQSVPEEQNIYAVLSG